MGLFGILAMYVCRQRSLKFVICFAKFDIDFLYPFGDKTIFTFFEDLKPINFAIWRQIKNPLFPKPKQNNLNN